MSIASKGCFSARVWAVTNRCVTIVERARQDELQTGDGCPLPAYLKAHVTRELDRLQLLPEQIAAMEKQRNALLAAQNSAAAAPAPAAVMLCTSKESVWNSHLFFGPKGCSVILTTGDRLLPMRGLRQRPGRAELPAANKACRSPAIRDCAPSTDISTQPLVYSRHPVEWQPLEEERDRDPSA
jgi:hypothetical protein